IDDFCGFLSERYVLEIHLVSDEYSLRLALSLKCSDLSRRELAGAR
ncbi:hypothetical protein A2U01_0055375, partial [Trifolium medium]|nr:hypothetical protein [Trifolium medium]